MLDQNPSPPAATTGWPALDDVLSGIQPGDNIVWGVDRIENYRKLVIPYEAAARRAGQRGIYFRFGPDEPLLDDSHGVEVPRLSPVKQRSLSVRKSAFSAILKSGVRNAG